MNRKKIAIISLAVLIFFVEFPQFNEGTDSSCTAVESRFFRGGLDDLVGLPLMGLSLITSSRGKLAQMMGERSYPHVPVPIACSAVYWEMWSKQIFHAVKKSLKKNNEDLF